ncbi:MAG: helix-turn-helix transcriptional regulator [Rhizobiales bacterium]|nr:helix-turn-helix transcriptional regulator [Hyphomicrobiales bacterium]
MSQDVLATKVGLSRTSITNIERGRQSVLVHQLFSFADALGASPAALLPSEASGQQLPALELVSPEVAQMVAQLQRTGRRK